jgi:protoheme IX farnesyltransferase
MTTATTDIPSPLGDTPGELVVQRPGALARLAAAYELTKPRMNFLVIITTAVGFYLAAGAAGVVDQPWLFINALVGTAMTAAAASILNQFLEREPDALMRRTAKRPLPAGLLSPGFALSAGLVLAVVGTAWLAILVNLLSAMLALFTMASYVLVYTPLKRRTSLCTAIGAVPGAVPPMIGVAAIAGALPPLAWALFAILFVWQMPHFFGLAILCRHDYARGGFAMLPTQPDGVARTARQSVLWLVLLLPVSLAPMILGITGWYYAAAATALGVWFLSAGVQCWWTRAEMDARRLFITSIVYLPLLLVAMMLDKL